MVGAWPLIGRQEELALVDELLDAAGGSGVVLAGAPGVGKTRLAQAIVERRSDVAHVEVVRATRSAATIPFGVLARFAAHVGEEPLGRLEALARIADELERAAAGRPLLLSVDDAHLLDDGSAALVAHLVEAGRAQVVLTVRTGAQAPDAVRALWKETLVDRIELQPLVEPESATLLAVATGAPVGEDARARVWELTAGNPLFLREVVATALAQGVLRRDGDRVHWQGTLARDARLEDLAGERLGALTGGVRHAVELVAMGEPIELVLLESFVSAADVAEAERAGVIAVDGDAVRLAHPLYGEIVRAGLGARRTAMLADDLADAVEALQRPEDALRIATWRLQGDPTRAGADRLVEASRGAAARADYDLAVRLAEAAHAAGAGAAAAPALGDALYFAGRHTDADAVLRATVDDTSVADELRRAAAITWASTRFWGHADRAGARAVLASAAASLAHPEAAEVRAHDSSIALFGGAVHEAVALAEHVHGDDGAGWRARLRAAPVIVAGRALAGEATAACALADATLPQALTATGELAGVLGHLVLGRCIALMGAGRFDEAEGVVRALAQLAVEQRRRDFHAPLRLFLGRVLLLRGKLDEAAVELDAAADLLATHDPGRFLSWCHGLRACVAGASGRSEDARAAVDAATAAKVEGLDLFVPDVLLGEAWALAADGSLSSARESAIAAARAAASAGSAIAAAQAWRDLARLGDPASAAPPLRDLARTVEGPLVPAWGALAQALHAGDGDALDGAADALESVGASLDAAEAATAAGLAHRRAGRADASLRAAARAAALRGGCPGARTPGLAGGGQPLLASLTAREREVVELAARGRTNREIAQELWVSIRTVNNHLNHAYAKLGLSDRSQLASALAADG